MTAFPTSPIRKTPGLSIPTVPLTDDEPTRQAKELATDSLIARTRAATPAGVANLRQQPRLSVAETNLLDFDTIRERFLATRRDDRPGWVKALDVLDLPRNQILSHLAPGLERKARERGDTAALGTGRVNFSEVLGELGMKPGVVRAIAGFVGDVAFDPLTYAGPPGWGVKVANKAGQGVRIGLRGKRALTGGLLSKGALKEVAAGGLGAVTNPEAAALFKVAARTAPAGLDNAALAAHLSEKVLGRVTSGKVGRALSRVGGDTDHAGGILANFDQFGLSGQLADEAEAARQFVRAYGKASAPGVKLGKNASSTIAHIPFTEWGIHVPAISGDGKAAREALWIASASGRLDPVKAAGPGVAAVKATLQKMQDIGDAIETGKMPVRRWEEQAVATPTPAAAPTPPVGGDPVYHYSDKIVDEYDNRPGGAWFTSNPKNYPRGKGTVRNEAFIDPKTLRLASKKDATNAGMFNGGTGWIDALKAQGFDGVKMTVDGDVHYNIFDPKNIGRASSPVVMSSPAIKVPIHATADDLMEDARRYTQEIDDLIDGTLDNQRAIDAATPGDVGDILALRRLREQAKATHDGIIARQRAKFPEGSAAAIAAEDPTQDPLAALAKANLRYADAVAGAAKNWAVGSGGEQGLAAVKRLLQTDDDVIGWSALAGPASAAKQADAGITADLAHRIDAARKTVFGQPRGALRSMYRYVQNAMTTGSREVFNSMESGARKSIVKALDDVGISRPTSADYEKASNLLLAHTHAVRNAQAAADPTRASLPYFETNFDGSEAKWVTDIKDAQRDGFFSKAADGKSLNDRLRDIAAEHTGIYDTLGSQEFTDKILKARGVGYVPHIITPGANQRIAAAKEQSLRPGPVGQAGQKATEAFQKERSTLQYRFTDSEGKPQQFWEKDRWVQGFKGDELEALRAENGDAATHVENLQKAIAEYDARAADEAGFAEQFAPRNTSPWELNEMVRNGAFDLMLNGRDEIPGGFADLNAATVLATRAMAHERAVARRTWLEYVKQFGVSVDPSATKGKVSGTTLVLRDGSEAKVYLDPKTGHRWYEQMGQRYRPLSGLKGVPKDNPILQAVGDTDALIYHEDVARLIETSANLFENDEVVRLIDQLTGVWKTTTLMHPGWTVGNIVGDGINYLTGGARATDMARNAKVMAQIVKNADSPEKLAGLSVTIRGVPVPADQFVNDLRHHGMLGNNRFAETDLQTHGRKMWVLPSRLTGTEARTGRGFIGKARAFAADFSPAVLKGDFFARVGNEASGHQAMKGAKAAGFVMRDRTMRRFVVPWFRTNEGVSDYMRALAYASFLEQGHDIPSAVQRTIRAGFDYADATKVERAYFKRLFPFYSWMRLNGAYQMKLLMERPIYAGSFPLLHHALEEAINGDQQVPMAARPAWMRNQLALMVGSDPEERFAVMLGSGLPVEQALVGISALTGGIDGAQDFLRYFTTSLNPVIRTPLEIGAGREFFTDRTIGSDGDFTVPGYVANQLRPVREVGKISDIASRQGAGQAISRGLLGGRSQAADDERLRIGRLREFQDEESKLRRAIATAGYKSGYAPGSPEFNAASLKPRAKQLKLYEQMIQAGFAEDTPKWAREQLGELTAAPNRSL